jgi:hypothetical protein
MGHVATIPLGNPPNNLVNGCLNLANAFPLSISTMHFHSSSTHVVVLEIDILIILNYYCYYYYSYFPIIWPIYNHCMVNIQHEKVNIRHMQSTYDSYTVNIWLKYNCWYQSLNFLLLGDHPRSLPSNYHNFTL